MLSAKPVFMEVRPFQVSNLCFEVGGILHKSFVELGTEVSAFDFQQMYSFFHAAILAPDALNEGRLVADSNNIASATQGPTLLQPGASALATLRAESLRAALDKAIMARSNAFITKYGPGAVKAYTDAMRVLLPQRVNQINHLSDLSQRMTDDLDAAYVANGLTGVVKATITTTNVTSTPGLFSMQTTTKVSDPNPDKVPGTVATQIQIGPADQPSETQTTRINNVEFRQPSRENIARNQRAQISIGQEATSIGMEFQYLDRLEALLSNELASMDLDVNRMQVAYLNTILLSPIDGIVTGVYKNSGDCVAAGEPVFRVENNATILIIANVVCRGPVLIGQILSITTTLFDGAGSPVPIRATIVAARGQGGDDQWEVIGKVANVDAAGKKIFPLGYRFDNDSAITQVTIFEPNEG